MNKTIDSSKRAAIPIIRSTVKLTVGATVLALLLSACVPLPRVPIPGPGPGPMLGPGPMRAPLSKGPAPGQYDNQHFVVVDATPLAARDEATPILTDGL